MPLSRLAGGELDFFSVDDDGCHAVVVNVVAATSTRLSSDSMHVPTPAAPAPRRSPCSPSGFVRLMYSSNSPRNLRIAFLIGQAAPSARPQIVVPGMMPIVSPISSSRSRSFSRPLPALMRSSIVSDQARAFAAGRALAAAFVGEEPATVVQEVDHRHGLVHHDDRRRAQAQAADLARSGEIERRVELRPRSTGPC